tara:strand:+ start:896 stop:2134 length:1239 start_codon:yes stop_codon:yes gene_type:complete
MKEIFFVFIYIFFSNVSFANSDWTSWYSSPLFSKNVSKDIYQFISNTSLLFEEELESQSALYTLNKHFDTLAGYQEEYHDIFFECNDKFTKDISGHNWPTDIVDCMYRKEIKIFNKYFLTPRAIEVAKDRFFALNQNATEFVTTTLLMKNYLTREEALRNLRRYENRRNDIIKDYYEIQVYATKEYLLFEYNKDSIAKNEQNRIGESLPEKSSGSGFYVSNNGHIVTNFHVIEGCKKIFLNDEVLKIIAKDPVNDLALLKSAKKNKEFLFIEQGSTKKGEEILVIGYPFGKDFGNESKVTKGIISSLQGMGNDYSRFQLDAAIQPGNSGGPVLNQKGKVVGVAVASANIEAFLEQYGAIPQNMNFAIKSNVLLMMLNSNNISVKLNQDSKNKSNTEIAISSDKAVLYLECEY